MKGSHVQSTLAGLLLQARRDRQLLAPLPLDAVPASFADSYAVQDEVVRALGGYGGWKVGSASSEAEPVCAPLPVRGIHPTGIALPAAPFAFIGIEVEIAFRFGRDLPLRAAPYGRNDVLDAVESVCAAIEVVDSRLADWRSRSPLEQCADLCNHGALIAGAASDAGAAIDQSLQTAELWVDGRKVSSKRGGNTAGDVQRLLLWLANHAAARGQPIRAGNIVTTGSCSGLYEAHAGERVRGIFEGVGEVELSLAGPGRVDIIER